MCDFIPICFDSHTYTKNQSSHIKSHFGGLSYALNVTICQKLLIIKDITQVTLFSVSIIDNSAETV